MQKIPKRRTGGAGLALLLLLAIRLNAHEPTRTTHVFEQGAWDPQAPRLVLQVTDRGTGRPTAARFSLSVDGEPYEPPAVGEHGLRFVTAHEGKGQRAVITYARGTGPVQVQLPPGAERVRVSVAKGLEYTPATADGALSGDRLSLDVGLRRWSEIGQEGWRAADEHLHYNRTGPADDRRWLTMMAGDDLAFAHFLVLRGGNGGAGVWATQYAYGPDGEAVDSRRRIVPGEEYRDRAQGHINLLGIDEVIEPISTGGLGRGAPPENYPPFHRVLRRARQRNGLGGVAHGAKLGRHPTAVADAVLGAVDFWEISNGFLRKTDLWYRLMNCGVVLPPAAGTNLPNYPGREPWQPFLGGVRMYVRTGEQREFAAWKQAVRRGEVFITSGPLLRFRVNDAGPGGTVRLPPKGGDISVEAELAGPRPLQALEILKNGQALEAEIHKSREEDIHLWRVRARVPIRNSVWLAARGKGAPIEGPYGHAFAHTGAVRVLVGDEPMSSPDDARALARLLRRQKAFYERNGRYRKPEHRRTVQRHFERAVEVLQAKAPE